MRKRNEKRKRESERVRKEEMYICIFI